MFKCFFFPSFFFGFAVVNFGAFDFDEEIMIEEGNDINKDKGKEKEENKDKKEEKWIREKGNIKDKENEGQDNDEDLNIYNNKKEDINNVRVDELSKDENIEKKQVRNEKNLVVSHVDKFEQLVLYYYIAVSFLLYAYKKADSTTTIFFELGDEQYHGPLDDDVFAVYKEFPGSDSKSMSTYYYCLSRFCGDALTQFLGVNEKKISYNAAYEKLCDKIKEFLSQVEGIDINLEKNCWQYESVQWAFTVALQVFAYKKIYEHLNKNNISLEENNQNAALQHDLVYVKFLSEMLYNIFKNVLESFLSDAGNTIRSRDLFFLRRLKPKNIGPENQKNMLYSAFSNLVFRPALLDGSVKKFLDCFYPIIKRMKRNK